MQSGPNKDRTRFTRQFLKWLSVPNLIQFMDYLRRSMTKTATGK